MQGAKWLYGSVIPDASLVSPTKLFLKFTKNVAASELKIGEDSSQVHFNITNHMDYLTETKYINSFLEHITLLEILLDSTKMEIRLPNKKVYELQIMLEQWSGQRAGNSSLSLVSLHMHAK